MAWLNLASWLPCTEVEGPGRRAAIWVQGCDKRCISCCNPQYLKIAERAIIPADAVIEHLLQAKADFDLEGVTFLGGEPFLQAQGLAVVAQEARQAGLSVMVFTGYTLRELEALSLPGTDRLLLHTDVLVDGPYDVDNPERIRNWVGSSNQRFHYLTDRYTSEIETACGDAHGLEWRVKADGQVVLNGWPFR